MTKQLLEIGDIVISVDNPNIVGYVLEKRDITQQIRYEKYVPKNQFEYKVYFPAERTFRQYIWIHADGIDRKYKIQRKKPNER